MPDADYTKVVMTTFTRPFYVTETELCVDGYGGAWKQEVRKPTSPDKATLIGSMVQPRVRGLRSQSIHLPLLDLDYSAKLIPSKTPGHFHLYLNKPIKWRTYKRFLRAMWKAGLLERGYYVMSKKRGQAFVRVPK